MKKQLVGENISDIKINIPSSGPVETVFNPKNVIPVSINTYLIEKINI